MSLGMSFLLVTRLLDFISESNYLYYQLEEINNNE